MGFQGPGNVSADQIPSSVATDAEVAAAIAALGLGTAATHSAGDFDAAGAAATAQAAAASDATTKANAAAAASQPLFSAKTKNKFYAGPVSGVDASPDFRVLNAADFLSYAPSIAMWPGQFTATSYSIALSSGDNNVYTPSASGKRALITVVNYAAHNGGAATIIPYWKIGGVNYQIAATASPIADGAATLVSNTFILEYGETFVVNSSVGNVNVNFGVIEFDATLPMRTVKVVSVVGDNTLFTCPANSWTALQASQTIVFAAASIPIQNFSGLLQTHVVYFIPSGGSKSSSTLVGGTSITTGTIGAINSMPKIMAAGDVFLINSTVAGTLSWANVMILPLT